MVEENSKAQRRIRFGTFELDPHSGDLRRDGKVRPRLQGQPLEVLLHLLEHPEELVTRESLRQRLWPADTFVDYDHSLNAAVNKLREALNDSADNPRFIQTIPRRGYRFISPVETAPVSRGNSAGPPMAPPQAHSEPDGADASPSQGSVVAASPIQVDAASTGVLSDAAELPKVPPATVRLLFSCIQVMYLAFYISSLIDLHRLEAAIAVLVHAPALLSALFIVLLATALAGIPVRLYLLSAALFRYAGLTRRFLTLFPGLVFLDELWALSPLLLADRIGLGLALAATAALLYVPFSQRSLLLMGNPHRRS